MYYTHYAYTCPYAMYMSLCYVHVLMLCTCPYAMYMSLCYVHVVDSKHKLLSYGQEQISKNTLNAYGIFMHKTMEYLSDP